MSQKWRLWVALAIKVRQAIVILVIICTYVPTANAVPSWTVIGGVSCSQLLKICSKGKLECMLATSWSAGFISGHNWNLLISNGLQLSIDGRKNHVMNSKIPFEDVQTQLIKKCKANPSSTQVKQTEQIMFDYFKENNQ